MAIVGVVVLFITLVALGGYFLYRSLPGTGDANGPDEPGTAADTQSVSSDDVLYITVVGDASDVLVRVPGGEVLTDSTMNNGEHVRYDEPRLDVTIGDPGAVRVYVNGQEKDISDKDSDHSFSVEAEQDP
ncbi:uncharacterized protein DUF4115 [Haloactinospora alba]|uniref:Uncharacterized protein DUF4115 n=1 Tax=Haloactinospora alba TaxID=405555 RepID=A0A543NP28_9ACTN|nr:RodZ domain-containing protein [Haloactinospora alba]TQN33526.1 uncharacterized protein DUF4115 [Haloactinospora alba]